MEMPYSVVTKDDLKMKMNKQIDEISNIFLVPKSVSTLLLVLFRWDSHKVSESLSENNEKLLSDSHNDDVNGSNESCGICLKTCDEIVDGLVTSMFGSNFGVACVREYLEKKFYSLEKNLNLTLISCPNEDCRGAVEKLGLEDKEKFDKYVLRSYIEENKVLKIKTCPASDCECVIEFHEDENDEEHSLNVVCICGHTFCWRCKLESHRPVTCNNASDWLSTIGKIGRDNEGANLDGWKDCQKTMAAAKCDLGIFERRIIEEPNVLREEDITTVREGLMLVVQCKQVLKWTCAYDYFHTEYEISKKEYLRFLQDEATTALQSYVKNLGGEIKRAFSAETYEDLGNLKDRLTIVTSNIGNYFYHFIKNLQDGLVDVKVNSYDGWAGQYWYCDRCTYGNTWIDKDCKMCCDSSASTLEEELSGLFIN